MERCLAVRTGQRAERIVEKHGILVLHFDHGEGRIIGALQARVRVFVVEQFHHHFVADFPEILRKEDEPISVTQS